MDFRHLIVTCLFSKLRLPFDNQKVKENYAIFKYKVRMFRMKSSELSDDMFSADRWCVEDKRMICSGRIHGLFRLYERTIMRLFR